MTAYLTAIIGNTQDRRTIPGRAVQFRIRGATVEESRHNHPIRHRYAVRNHANLARRVSQSIDIAFTFIDESFFNIRAIGTARLQVGDNFHQNTIPSVTDAVLRRVATVMLGRDALPPRHLPSSALDMQLNRADFMEKPIDT
jgi:hypothetical protein